MLILFFYDTVDINFIDINFYREIRSMKVKSRIKLRVKCIKSESELLIGIEYSNSCLFLVYQFDTFGSKCLKISL